MLQLQSHHHHHYLFAFSLSQHHHHHHYPTTIIPPSLSPLLPLHRPSATTLSSVPRKPFVAIAETQDENEEEGPIELPPSSSPFSSSSIFATTDNPTPLQISTSVLLTGAISIFLFRSLRRRAKRAKELKFRSSGVKKSLKEEAMENLKAMGSASIEAKSPPSPAQAFLGAISAGVIALILYKFATTVEAALNRQTISDNFSVRQITITIRTIVNGLCYLATFVFGINSIGLFLYSGQLAINSFMEGSDSSTSDENNTKVAEKKSLLDSASDSPSDDNEANNNGYK